MAVTNSIVLKDFANADVTYSRVKSANPNAVLFRKTGGTESAALRPTVFVTERPSGKANSGRRIAEGIDVPYAKNDGTFGVIAFRVSVGPIPVDAPVQALEDGYASLKSLVGLAINHDNVVFGDSTL